ncbi:hypothetical protein XI06_14140 [Bradyrhizobium sp. CCBAU 11434]|uniref:hypothetical protein n=1 Tax=Bradyrhizobium sp. CCBAU 11434 TaxID=1630885 RepID=UPI00230560B1|nr:hypothetical protein [Bradyrhizobium sp. CCBAU 11434]MDA9521461.1 hypothetical protein [Bradyrhizobium sp. CCBAU 11434]
MMIKKALICAKDQKTDDELKAIMATHPWAPGMIHGFYKSDAIFGELIGRMTYGAIWIDAGFGFGSGNWMVESFHCPEPAYPCSRPLPSDPMDDGWYQRRKAWWKATSELIRNGIPDDYRVYIVYYGEIEDDFDFDGTQGGDAAVAEASWRKGILAHFNYSPEVEAAVGAAVNA